MIRFIRSSLSFASVALAIGSLEAKDRHKATLPPQDQIEVVAHPPSNGENVTRFVMTQHYRREYLYATSTSGRAVSLIDVTDPAKPSLLADVTLALAGGNVVTAAGTAALISDSGNSADTAKPQTFRIMSFADPTHPVVSQEFADVTAIGRDDKRGLIFLANAQGVWILHEKLAMDPEFEKEWEHMMLDNR